MIAGAPASDEQAAPASAPPDTRQAGARNILPWLVIALTAGALFTLNLSELPSLTVLCALALSTLPAWRGRALWSACVLGIVLTSWHGQRYLDQRWPVSRHGEKVVVRGTIASLPERETTLNDHRPTWRFQLAPTDAGLPDAIRVAWYRSDADRLRAGDCWQFTLRMRTPHGSFNPDGFDYEGWLMQRHIAALASVASAEPCARRGGFPIQSLRQRIVDRIAQVIESPRAAAWAAALTVGDTGGLRKTDWDSLRKTGTTHLVAISGFNLAIVAGFAFFVLRWLWSAWPRLCLWWPAQRFALIGAAVCAVFYALLAGFEPPVTRALLMILFVLAAALLGRLHLAGHALLLAWGVIVAIDPFALLSPGLWLSFAAVAAIFYVTLGRWGNESVWRTALRVQLFLSLALAPMSLHFFHGLSWSAPLVNLLVVPVFTVLTPAVLLAVGGAFVPGGEWPLIAPLMVIGSVIEQLAAALDWVAADWPGNWLPAAASRVDALLGTLACALLFLPRGTPLRWLALPAALPLLWPVFWPVAPALDDLRVDVLDVGQGSAIVVRTAQHTLLFDAGPAFDEGFDAGASVVVPFLLEAGVRRLDRMIISHGDNDHAGGADAVRAALPVLDELGAGGGRPCDDGERWEWEGVRFALLHPDGGRWSDNNRSCVLHIDGPFDVLLPGDIERGAERRLLAAHGTQLKADLLLAPHHGSRTSSTPDFVDAVSPQVVVHSAGWRSRYGHPKPDVVARYARRDARQYVSGVQGALAISGAAQAMTVHAWRVEHARWWNLPAEP